MPSREPEHLEALALAKREVEDLLGVPLDRALEMLDSGQLAGTAAEAEPRMLRFVLDR